MSQEVRETLLDIWIYLSKTLEYVKPLWVLLTTIISYVLFPENSYIPATIALVSALILDVITKYYSISVQNGGLKNAIKTKKILSETLWRGTKKKIVSVLIVMILCGLSYRVSTISSVAVLLSTVAYSFMFLRESQSIIENMVDAGHDDLNWFLFFIKKKQKEILDVPTEEKTNDDSKANTIPAKD